MEIKKNAPLILGISIPILMILFVAISIYLPGIFIHPKVDFLYVSGDGSYNNDWRYYVQANQLFKSKIDRPVTNYGNATATAKLYIHDVQKNESREISFEDAEKLNLDSSIKSPDGFEVVSGGSVDGLFPLLFGSSGNNNSRYLKGHNVSKKLNIQLNSVYYYNNFRFLGWIK